MSASGKFLIGSGHKLMKPTRSFTIPSGQMRDNFFG